jgi:hypothetical protein
MDDCKEGEEEVGDKEEEEGGWKRGRGKVVMMYVV